MIEFNLDRISDPYVREVLQRIREDFQEQPFLRGQWRFVELTFTSNITNFKYPHGLKFQPKDVLQTALTGTGAIAYNISRFDATNLDVTTSGTSASSPLVARFFVGRYEEQSKV